jgi:putative tricarboxylic transport membrane protein
MNALKPLGFVPAGLILFCCVAFAFGSRKYLRDAVVGVLLALVAYVGFKYGLGLQLPPGILEGIL